MPLRWISPPGHAPTPASAQMPPVSPTAEPPKFVLAAPGSITPSSLTTRNRLTHALAAGSLLAVALRPMPRSQTPRTLATTFTVNTLNPSGAGSLWQAVKDANANPGADTITFQTGLTGTIALTGTLVITGSVQIINPGPGLLSVSGGSTMRVFYLSNKSSSPLTATITGLTIRDGSSSKSGGGIQANNFDLTLDQVNLISNTAGTGTSGGGLEFDETPLFPKVSLTIRDSFVSGNHAFKGGGIQVYYTGGGVVITNTQIVSNTSVGAGAGVNLGNSGPLLIEDSTIMSNTAGGNGGGIREHYPAAGAKIIRRTTISGNKASGAAGGGVFFEHGGNFLIEDSTIAGNMASKGGGIYGGYLYGANIIRRTTISGNTALQTGGGIRFFYAGGFLIENSTLSGNHAGQGGGVYLYKSSPISIKNSTIFSNTAASSGGGIAVHKQFVPITDTIIAGNVAPLGPDITGTFQLRYDLVQITGTAAITNAGGNQFGLDPLLGPLANNGGPTQTHFPNLASPVVNMGDPAFASPPANDQRGRLRVVGGRIDIGAVEVSPSSAQLSSSSYQVNENGLTVTVTVTRTGGSDGAASVDYATGGGTAIAGTDYQTATGTLHWADGDAAAKTFTVQIIDDNLVDGTASVGLQLSNPQGGVQLGSPITGTLTIVELNPGAVQLSSSSYLVDESGVTVTVTVTRTGGSDGAVAVDYATGGGTASAGTDYQTATGTLNWANGDAAPKTFTVQITDDNLLDGTATVGLHLSNPQGGVLLGSPITGTLTIVDNLFTLDLPLIRR